MSYEGTTSDRSFAERGEAIGGMPIRGMSIPDLRIGDSPVEEYDIVPEPSVTRRLRVVAAPEIVVSNDSDRQPANQSTEGMAPEDHGDVSGHSYPIERAGRQVVRAAADWFGAAGEKETAQGHKSLADGEIPGQPELPFHELPVPPGTYVQGEFDFDAIPVADQASEHEPDAPSRDLVPFGEIVDAEIVDEQEMKTPEQVVAEQKEITHEVLKAAVKEHERLVREHENQWGLFVDALRSAKPVYKISYYQPQAGGFSIDWRIDDNSYNPLSGLDEPVDINRPALPDFDEAANGEQPNATFRFFDIRMTHADFRGGLPREAHQAIGWLAGDRPEGKRKQLKDTSLLGVPAKKGADGAYGYETDDLSMKLAEQLVGHAKQAQVAYYTAEKPEDTPFMHDKGLIVTAPDEYSRQMHEDLQEVRDGGERTERIVEQNLERFRLPAQIDPEDRGNPLAFPTLEKIVDMVSEKYLYRQASQVDSLRKLNYDLAGLLVVSRSFRSDKPSRR